MVNRCVVLFITLCMGWHALAFGGAGVVVSGDKEQLHELLHFHGTAHHHHDSGDDRQPDDAVSGLMHVAGDSGIFSPAMIVSSFTVPICSVCDTPVARPSEVRPSAALDVPERPPRPLP